MIMRSEGFVRLELLLHVTSSQINVSLPAMAKSWHAIGLWRALSKRLRRGDSVNRSELAKLLNHC